MGRGKEKHKVVKKNGVQKCKITTRKNRDIQKKSYLISNGSSQQQLQCQIQIHSISLNNMHIHSCAHTQWTKCNFPVTFFSFLLLKLLKTGGFRKIETSSNSFGGNDGGICTHSAISVFFRTGGEH